MSNAYIILQVNFYYFGVTFISRAVSIDKPLLEAYSIRDEIFTMELKDLKDAMVSDMALLNSSRIGAKTKAERESNDFDKWKCNGSFTRFANNAYVYRHTNHATFSSINMSQLLHLWPSKREIIRNEACAKHPYHDNFESYFRSNSCLKSYIDSLGDNCDPRRSNTLRIYKESLQKESDDLVYEPEPLVFSWNEDDWTRRLYGCLKLTFPNLYIQLMSKQGTVFNAVQTSLTNGLACANAYIFHGVPDLLVKKKRVICATTRMSTEVGADVTAQSSKEASEDDSSGDECLMVELSWKRNPMKNAVGYCYPEKLGELLAALHFAMVSKLLRKISKGKHIHEYSVRGLLLDKILGSIHCKLTCKGNEVRKFFIEVHDASGEVLTPQSLCYNLQVFLNDW